MTRVGSGQREPGVRPDGEPGARSRALLALEDGTFFEGLSFGRRGEVTGEVVFNTALCGYQEVLTDPSYAGQIVTMTYPHIGNYGVNREDVESARPQVAGFIVREASHVVSSWRASGSLARYLDANGIVGISEIDTRALTRHLRTHGAKRGVISALDLDRDSLVAKARASRSMIGLDLAREVTCEKPWALRSQGGGRGRPSGCRCSSARPRGAAAPGRAALPRRRLRLRDEAQHPAQPRAAGCEVTVVPATTSARDALALEPEGIFLSNGPGDPEPCTYAIEAAKAFVDTLPTFGICLGHQILGLACGGKTYKLKFGHRGANHPVKNLETGQVEITSQNHGFCVDPSCSRSPAS
jgi:carbamoyl-phosphate synthase small subunit